MSQHPPRIGRRQYQQHGLNTLLAGMRRGGVIDRSTALGRALLDWRNELLADLGGAATVSASQQALLDQAVRTRLFVDSIDAWLTQQPTLINKRTRSLFPVVRERQQLADALVRILTALGLEKRTPSPKALSAYVASRYGTSSSEPSAPGPTTRTRRRQDATSGADAGQQAGAGAGLASEPLRLAGDSVLSLPLPPARGGAG